MSAETWAAIGAISASVAAFAALGGLVLSKRSLDAGRDTVTIAAQTQQASEASRQAAEQDRRRYRLERIGELVEELFWATALDGRYNPPAPPQGNSWMDARNRLAQASVGYKDVVPAAVEATNAATYEQAHGSASRARAEVEVALRRDVD